MTMFRRCIARVLVVCTVAWGVPLPAAAGWITTDRVQVGAEREQVAGFLARADVQARMEALGVDGRAAQERVAALTDAEVVALADRIDQLPAGGDVLGVLFAVFIVLLVTDILGLTKVFPFTRSVR